VLVSSRSDMAWRDIFVHFDWGDSANAEIRARIGDLPPAAIELELGILSLEWLTSTGGAGFVPERMATRHLHEGTLAIVAGVPSVEFSPFICWRASLDATLCDALIALARRHGTQPTPADAVHPG